MLKFRRLFLLLFFQCCLGYAIKGEPENDYHTIQSIENLDTDVSNASATDLQEKNSLFSQSNDTESLKTTFLSSRIGDHETDESQTKVTEDITNKTINQSANHTGIMFSKIGVRGGKTGGSKIGGSKTKVGGSKTRVGGGRGYHWRPYTKSSGGGGGGGGLTALWIILGIAGVFGTGFLVCLLISKYTE